VYIVDRARAFAQAEGKKLLIFLSYSVQDVADACSGRPRFDQEFVDYLREDDLPVADVLPKHVDDFGCSGCPPEEYAQRYYIGAGHYNPKGNHFFAFAVKDAVVEWLDPPAPTYRRDGAPSLRALSTG
jgi:hypothetical protein